MKAAVIAVIVTGLCVTVYLAGEGKGGGQSFEAKKAEVLHSIAQRIAHNSAEMTCVQAASSYDALETCREKFRVAVKNDREARNQGF